MAIEETEYISYPEAVLGHILLMYALRETRFGVDNQSLIESALARPKHAAVYEKADVIRQAATLCFGLIKNHPWRGGKKRTATALTELFLFANGWALAASIPETIEMVLAVEANLFGVKEIEAWYRQRTTFIAKSQ